MSIFFFNLKKKSTQKLDFRHEKWDLAIPIFELGQYLKMIID
jgi:hypothetical protein